MKIHTTLKGAHRLSKIFQPINVVPKNAQIKKQELTSISQKLMLDMGIVRHANPGCFHYLPLGLRSLEKLNKIVDDEMQNIGAQKINLPTLTNADLWKKTGRLDNDEIATLKDRHNKMYVISPTYEEAITELVASIFPISYKQFPLLLYQITNKFRDEIKPRFGLIRGREFIMKDLYSFDTNIDCAQLTYDIVSKSYENIFLKIGVNYTKVLADPGNIGGSLSHEYHFMADIGEDEIFHCRNCHYFANVEVAGREKCPNCDSNRTDIRTGIEVGHTFLLGDKYSKPLKAYYLSQDGKPSMLQMGCYGLGISRILAASIELLSEENEMRWPLALAPYKVVVISPKEGSKEEPLTNHLVDRIQTVLNCEPALADDILLDDRKYMTIGKRLFEARRVGYPFIIVIGNLALQDPPLYEIYDLIKNERHNFNETEILSYIKETLSTSRVKENLVLYDVE